MAKLGPRASLAVRLPTRVVGTYRVKLNNIGQVDSDEVVQVYMVPRFSRPGLATLHRQLIDFARVHVVAGTTEAIVFEVTAEQLELVDLTGARTLHSGDYQLRFTNGVGALDSVELTI